MPRCCAYGCTTKQGQGKGLFKFPSTKTDPVRREAWITAVCREDWSPSQSTVLCSDHFTDDAFVHPPSLYRKFELKGNLRLLPNAVPSVFNYTKPPQPRDTSRKTRKVLKSDALTEHYLKEQGTIVTPQPEMPCSLSPSRKGVGLGLLSVKAEPEDDHQSKGSKVGMPSENVSTEQVSLKEEIPSPRVEGTDLGSVSVKTEPKDNHGEWSSSVFDQTSEMGQPSEKLFMDKVSVKSEAPESEYEQNMSMVEFDSEVKYTDNKSCQSDTEELDKPIYPTYLVRNVNSTQRDEQGKESTAPDGQGQEESTSNVQCFREIPQERKRNDRLMKCRFCAKTFSQNTTVKKILEHEGSHKEGQPHKCDFRGQTFSESQYHSRHTKIHSLKTYTCSLCSISFALECSLVRHVRVHHGEKQIKQSPYSSLKVRS